SISSNSTLRPPFSIDEERYFRLNTLYHICMDATSTYINSLLPSTRHRHNQLPRHRNHGSRYHPYPAHRSGRGPGGAGNCRRHTLMNNIRDISTNMWRRARSDGMAPHRAEADAVQAMRDLYAWSVVVAQGMESDGINLGQGEDGDDVRDAIAGINVAHAAMRLCEWLGDERAWRGCDGILRELRDLLEMEAA
ncbi:hypothetical protein DL98DRAFT_365064, partial [Cadophora sp. DSE1049]